MSSTQTPTEPQTPPNPTTTLSNGATIPTLGFGLYQCSQSETSLLIKSANVAGYTHYDSASFYDNEKDVGHGIKELLGDGSRKRSDLFITSKVWNDKQKLGREGVRESVFRSIKELQCGYIDLFLVHWPVPNYHCSTYKYLEEMVATGEIKNLGISNYNIQEYEQLLNSGISIHPVVNQIEISPLMYRKETITYFQEKGITMQAYKPLQRGGAISDVYIKELAIKYQKSAAQILIRWCYQKGFVVLCKTSNGARMVENRDIFGFVIGEEDMNGLDLLTTDEAVVEREAHELKRKVGL